jgi:hypothetical protein
VVGAALKPQDHHVIIESGDDRSTALASQVKPFDALIFSHVLSLVADPIALFGEPAVQQPCACWMACDRSA